MPVPMASLWPRPVLSQGRKSCGQGCPQPQGGRLRACCLDPLPGRCCGGAALEVGAGVGTTSRLHCRGAAL